MYYSIFMLYMYLLYIYICICIYMYIYIYIYIFIYISAVKISTLTQAIHFFQFNAFKLFNVGAGLGLANPL